MMKRQIKIHLAAFRASAAGRSSPPSLSLLQSLQQQRALHSAPLQFASYQKYTAINQQRRSQSTPSSTREPEASSSRHTIGQGSISTSQVEQQGSLLERSGKHPLNISVAEQPEHGSSSLRKAVGGSHLRKPTKEELLSVATGFLQRLRIRFKWLTIRGMRPYRIDDWSAFFSWILSGVGIWIAVGTTSFISVVFLLLNSLQMQEWLAKKLGTYMTASSGVSVVFDSAIVPRFSWRDSTISFKHVSVSRGVAQSSSTKAQQQQPQNDDSESAPVQGQVKPHFVASPEESSTLTKFRQRASELVKRRSPEAEENDSEQTPSFDPTKQTAFAITVDSIDVSLSLPRWLDGKGIIKDAVVKGVRGVVDRSQVVYDPEALTDRTAYRHKAQMGDFHLESLVLEDFLVTIYQPDHFRPYTWSIFSAHIPTLRKQWLFLDLMSAESIVGQVDNCLFSLHRPQFMNRTNEFESEAAQRPESKWKRLSRFRVDGVNIDHLKGSQSSGPLSWITSGQCDIVADIRLPKVEENDSFEAIIGDIADRFDEVVQGQQQQQQIIPGQKELSGGKVALAAPKASTRQLLGLNEPESEGSASAPEPSVLLDLSIRFKDIKATIPLFNQNLGYVNGALIRPIVAFLNANRTLIPIVCQVEVPISEFDGSWTTYDTGILDAISEQVYLALAFHIQNSNDRRARQVGLWSLQLTARGVISALKKWNEREGLGSQLVNDWNFA